MWDEDFPGQSKVIQALQAEPERFGPRLTVAFATKKAAEACHLAHRVTEGGRLAVYHGHLRDHGQQRFPFSVFEEHRARNVWRFAAELGEASVGSPHYQVLFIIGLLLFMITFAVNLTADLVVRGIRRK